MTIKRMIASISAQVETLVTSIENHEAIADCAIAEARQATAKLSAQLKINAARVQRFARELEDVDEQITQWQQRAKNSVDNGNDREKALQCMQAAKNCRLQRDHLLGQLSHSQSLEVELRQHLCDAEQQLLNLQHKKASLSARSARNRVLRGVNGDENREQDREALFLRWEEKILTEEYTHGALQHTDSQLNTQFLIEENRVSLESELDELLSAEKNSEEVKNGNA